MPPTVAFIVLESAVDRSDPAARRRCIAKHNKLELHQAASSVIVRSYGLNCRTPPTPLCKPSWRRLHPNFPSLCYRMTGVGGELGSKGLGWVGPCGGRFSSPCNVVSAGRPAGRAVGLVPGYRWVSAALSPARCAAPPCRTQIRRLWAMPQPI